VDDIFGDPVNGEEGVDVFLLKYLRVPTI